MIKLFTGPMSSGKSAIIIQLYETISEMQPVLCFKPKKDTRSEYIISRNGKEIFAISVDDFTEIHHIIKRAFEKDDIKCFIIDEVQFLEEDGMIDFVKFVKMNDIKVYVSGLNLTSELKPFETIAHLSMYADEIEFIKGKCIYCRHDSEVTKCNVVKTSEILVGDDIYVGTCYKCHK